MTLAASPARPLRSQRPRWPSAFICPITASMAERRVSSRLMRPKTPRFWPEMKTAARVWGIVAAVSLVDIGTLDLAAGEPLSGFDDGAQRVAVIRIGGQRPGVQNKLATRCPGIGGDDGSFHTEFVRRAGLALADALHLRSVEGIQLPAALALLLRADLIGTREWPGEYRLEFRVACDLSPDVANEPAEAGAQNAQLSTVAVELFGMGITPCHHGGALGDAHIRLPQPYAALPGQSG